MKICSNVSVIREMRIKLPDWHSEIFDNTMWMKVRETDAQTYCWWECKLPQPPAGKNLTTNIDLSLKCVCWQAP